MEVESGRLGEGWKMVETVIVLRRLICMLGVEGVEREWWQDSA